MINQKSLKQNLIKTLLALMVVVLVITYLISFFITKDEIEEVFDANLAKSARLIHGLVKHEIFDEKDSDFVLDFDEAEKERIFHRYEYKINSQIWSGAKLVYSSSKDHLATKPEQEGFQDILIDEKSWRSFAFYDAKSDLTILVLERQRVRNKLTNEIIFSLFLPLILSFIPLFLIVAATVNKSLKPLDRLANKIKKMSTKTLEKFDAADAPLELRPFINSFNSLLVRLQDSMESERRFTDYAAHELKTPLAAITIQAQLLLKNKNEEKRAEYLNDLILGIGRMSHMVNQLLTLARLDPESEDIEKENLDLRKLTQEILKNYAEKMAEKNLKIDFICELSERKTMIEANKTYIEILLRNLVDNAVKHSLSGKVITVNLSEKNHLLNLRITNHGANISQEDVKKIFNNFYRVSSESADKDGCGLGLAIAKKIIDLHGGSISFESKNNLNSVEVCFFKISN